MYRKPSAVRPRFAAFIPARGGSRRLPGKNLRKLRGMTLVEHAIEAARYCDDIYVSTDSQEIGAVARAAGAEVVRRPAELCLDTSSTEEAVTHWLSTMTEADKPDAILLLQPSTPMFDGAVWPWAAMDDFVNAAADSLVAVDVDTHLAFAGDIVAVDELPTWKPHRDIMSRPRTQDVLDKAFECGAFWIFTREHFERTGCRQGGFCYAFSVPKWSYVDIDTAEDLAAAEALSTLSRRR